MRILVSGASGFVGKPLVCNLRMAGHTVVRVARTRRAGADDIVWDPDRGFANPSDFEDFDAAIHLAGASISSFRWTESVKRKILLSRTLGTSLLAKIFCAARRPPKVFLSPSAIGYYGDRKEEEIDDGSSRGQGFLSDVCLEWEQAAKPLTARGVRIVHPRFGTILGKGGGMLQRLLLPYRMGLGGRLGSGRQWMSWISLNDAVSAMDFALRCESIDGAFLAVSPNPVRQIEFAQTLAGLLHRPACVPLPEWLLRLLFGEMAEELLLAGAKAHPSRLLSLGFRYKHVDLDSALLASL